MTATPTPSKACTKCNTVKPLSDFPARRGIPGGDYACRECVRERGRAYREANRERGARRSAEYYRANREAKARYDRERRERDKARLTEQKRAYYKANFDAIAARKAEYRLENLDAARARDRAYYEANREEWLERGRAWREANPERRREINRRNQQARRARKLAVSIGPVDPEALWTGVCGICGDPMDRTVQHPDPASSTLDHIVPLAKGGPHEQSNLQWAHRVCNIRKGARLPDTA